MEIYARHSDSVGSNRNHVKKYGDNNDKNNTSVSEYVDPIFTCKNRYMQLREVELNEKNQTTEVCVTAAILKKLDTSIAWELEKKNDNVCIFRKTNKPVII